jgi:hypothetical protein
VTVSGRRTRCQPANVPNVSGIFALEYDSHEHDLSAAQGENAIKRSTLVSAAYSSQLGAVSILASNPTDFLTTNLTTNSTKTGVQARLSAFRVGRCRAEQDIRESEYDRHIRGPLSANQIK